MSAVSWSHMHAEPRSGAICTTHENKLFTSGHGVSLPVNWQWSLWFDVQTEPDRLTFLSSICWFCLSKTSLCGNAIEKEKRGENNPKLISLCAAKSLKLMLHHHHLLVFGLWEGSRASQDQQRWRDRSTVPPCFHSRTSMLPVMSGTFTTPIKVMSLLERQYE